MSEDSSLVMRLGFECLEDAVAHYRIHQEFAANHLESLRDFFGHVFDSAAELLENCKITQYQTEDGIRKVFKVSSKKEHYTVYENINFCHCPVFRYQVLGHQHYTTCKHVLAVTLGDAMGKISKETVTGSQMVDFLTEQLNHYLAE